MQAWAAPAHGGELDARVPWDAPAFITKLTQNSLYEEGSILLPLSRESKAQSSMKPETKDLDSRRASDACLPIFYSSSSPREIGSVTPNLSDA